MKKTLPNMIRFLLVILSVVTIGMALLWTPNLLLYIKELIPVKSGSNWLDLCTYSLSALITLITVSIFIISFKFPTAIENNEIFTLKIADILKVIALLVISDCALLSSGVAILFISGETLIAPLIAFVAVIGITVSSTLLVLSKYVKDAAYLKEEVDHTL